MKKIKIIPAFFITLIQLIAMTAFGQNTTEKKAVKGFALLELYTSEGCSSCPPADELMGRIQNEYKDENVYILAYHVDYWDRQGWKDVFGNADFTKRQYEYATFLGKQQVYTPQVIVNGKADYIASQETIVRNAIKQALSKPAASNLSLQANQNNNNLNVNYTVEGVSKNSNLLIAIVQKYAKSNVKRGENANRILSHYQIVHHLQIVDLAKEKKGTTSIHLPKNFDAKEFEIIGFVQDMKTGSILGVTKAILQQSSL
ncbi:DUF1223 domain-containing protein [Flavobacterium sp. ANB]|uniref:DUF1223 domain-containing protein n=1 Tax=unclassified Flavobacterium TaxID=196869 RepID=UPI0012B8A752|nr:MULTISPECIES: DUF1223 domain-containing protein [unclassified Flavobacterium]MBF4515603.1 DUF1223 domain-containing protein [Flavobacterium sp. ANB]MTD68606.1 DUF1223 domain-containing protein [Flavobacterium sp. LC2016-13]